MKKLFAFGIILLLISILTAGCVSQKKYDQLEQAYKSIQDGYDSAMKELDAMDLEVESLRTQIEERKVATEEDVRRIQEAYGELISGLNKEISQGKIEVEQIKGKLQLTVAEEIFFDSGKAELKTGGEDVLNRIGETLKKLPEKNIRVEGHTDNVRIGKALRQQYPTNWELGASRAVKVIRYMEEQVGIDPLRLSAVSYAQYRPIASNKTKSGRAKNRRIEIVLVERDLDLANKMKENL